MIYNGYHIFNNIPDIKYTGVDIVENVINNHIINYPNINFIVDNLITINWSKIPNSDLFFIKDVLQHWKNEDIILWLNTFFMEKPNGNLIVINCDLENIRNLPQWKDHTSDRSMKTGEFKPLSQKYFPLSEYDSTELFSYDTKKVYLVKNKQST